MLEFLRKQLAKLQEERVALAAAVDKALEAARAEKRDALTEAETTAFAEAREALKKHDEEILARAEAIKEAEADEARAAKVAALHGATPEERAAQQRAPIRTGAEPTTYRKGGSESYFRDLAMANVKQSSDAIARLQRNDREVQVDLEARGLTTVDGAGGEFVPPLWVVDDYVKLARAGRVVADQLNGKDLPGGTDSINLPKIATGTSTAEQATQNTALSDTDMTTSSVEAKVATIGGKQIVAVQLLEQSPLGAILDEVILGDLAADYAVRADVFVISNNAAGKRGLLNVTGINAVTYTDASPTAAELYPKIGDGIQQIHTNRFMPAEKIFMHPRRWAWLTVQVDSTGRPLVIPAANLPQNVIAAMGENIVAEGFVGMLQGLPVYVDANIPVNLGAGTNEDRIITARTSDVLFMEGSPRAEAFRETKADQLSVLFRFYNYAALHSERFPKSISVISGTGLITPTF